MPGAHAIAMPVDEGKLNACIGQMFSDLCGVSSLAIAMSAAAMVGPASDGESVAELPVCR
jgi:hypothetical protein